MPDDTTFNDIAQAIYALRIAFRKHGLEPPKAIELGSHEDGMSLKSRLPKEMFYANPQMFDGDPKVVGSIVGVDIYWPAEFRSRARGGFDIG